MNSNLWFYLIIFHLIQIVRNIYQSQNRLIRVPKVSTTNQNSMVFLRWQFVKLNFWNAIAPRTKVQHPVFCSIGSNPLNQLPRIILEFPDGMHCINQLRLFVKYWSTPNQTYQPVTVGIFLFA